MNGLNHINYLYDVAGNKLCKLTMQDLAIEHTTDYLGNIVYVDDEIRYILTDEGRVVFNPDGSHEYQYFLKDHLGNTRVTFGEDGHIIQENSYYPFGMSMTGLSHQTGEDLPNKYLYNAKELQDDYGLDWYEYGVRFYDPVIGRWHVVDPLTHERNWVTSYNYVQNNPLNRIDPNGALDDEWNLNTKTGEMTWVSNMGGDEVQFVNFITSHENGAIKYHGTNYIDGAVIFSGPMAINYDGDFTFGVSNKDLWSDIPKEYHGHYMAWDLKLRYVYSNMSNKTQINSIRSQEAMGLDRREMIWNSSDEYKRIVNKYGTDASFVMAYEYGMMPLPVGQLGTMSNTQRSLALGRSSYFKAVAGGKGSNFFKNIAVYSTQPKLSNNPWIRFLQMNKGKYRGQGWLNDARQDYYFLKAVGGL